MLLDSSPSNEACSYYPTSKYLTVKGLSQDLETKCLKLAIVKFWGVQIFYGGLQYTQISAINMYKFIKIRHDILI